MGPSGKTARGTGGLVFPVGDPELRLLLACKKADAVINAVMDTVIKQVVRGEKITLVGFGTFEARQRKARTGRNPKTNEPIEIPAKRVAGFKPGKEFAEAVNKKGR